MWFLSIGSLETYWKNWTTWVCCHEGGRLLGFLTFILKLCPNSFHLTKKILSAVLFCPWPKMKKPDICMLFSEYDYLDAVPWILKGSSEEQSRGGYIVNKLILELLGKMLTFNSETGFFFSLCSLFSLIGIHCVMALVLDWPLGTWHVCQWCSINSESPLTLKQFHIADSDNALDHRVWCQQIMMKLSILPYIGQRVLLLTSRQIVQVSERLVFMEPFDDGVSQTYENLFFL